MADLDPNDAEQLKQLMKRAQAGDAKALQLLFSLFSDQLIKVTLNFVQDRPAAEEITALALTYWATHWDTFTGDRTFHRYEVQRWLLNRVFWHCSDWLETHPKGKVVSKDDIDTWASEHVAAPDRLPNEEFFKTLFLDDFDDCWAELAPPDRALMSLRHTGMAIKRIANSILFGFDRHNPNKVTQEARNTRFFVYNDKVLKQLRECMHSKGHFDTNDYFG